VDPNRRAIRRGGYIAREPELKPTACVRIVKRSIELSAVGTWARRDRDAAERLAAGSDHRPLDDRTPVVAELAGLRAGTGIPLISQVTPEEERRGDRRRRPAWKDLPRAMVH